MSNFICKGMLRQPLSFGGNLTLFPYMFGGLALFTYVKEDKNVQM